MHIAHKKETKSPELTAQDSNRLAQVKQMVEKYEPSVPGLSIIRTMLSKQMIAPKGTIFYACTFYPIVPLGGGKPVTGRTYRVDLAKEAELTGVGVKIQCEQMIYNELLAPIYEQQSGIAELKQSSITK